MGGRKGNTSRQIDSKPTKQVRIDSGLHILLKVDTAKSGESIKERLDSYICEGFDRDKVIYD